jgi:hypothetical protein
LAQVIGSPVVKTNSLMSLEDPPVLPVHPESLTDLTLPSPAPLSRLHVITRVFGPAHAEGMMATVETKS